MASWTRPSVSGQGPCPRCAHTTDWCNGKICVFGGWSGQRLLSDAYWLRMDTMRWNKATPAGEPPCNRSGHSASTVGSKIYVFGL